MNINKFTYASPDEDGDMNFGVSVVVHNQTEETIELVVQKMVFHDKTGRPVSSHEAEQECDISAGESAEFEEGYCSYVNSSLFDGNMEEAQVSINATLCKLHFAKAPAIEISSDTFKLVGLSEPFSVDEQLEVTGISAWLTKSDDDGDFQLEVRSSFRNLTEKAIPKIHLKACLVDKRGRDLDETESDGWLGGGGLGLSEFSFWEMKNKKLDGAQLQIEFTVFSEVAVQSGHQSGASLNDD